MPTIGAQADLPGGVCRACVARLSLSAFGQPCLLVAVQALDGVGAGIFGALFPIIVRDLTAGTGSFNLSQGAIATAQGIGASLSIGVAGLIVVYARGIAMPETKPNAGQAGMA
jgi:hypothetical protein